MEHTHWRHSRSQGSPPQREQRIICRGQGPRRRLLQEPRRQVGRIRNHRPRLHRHPDGREAEDGRVRERIRADGGSQGERQEIHGPDEERGGRPQREPPKNGHPHQPRTTQRTGRRRGPSGHHRQGQDSRICTGRGHHQRGPGRRPRRWSSRQRGQTRYALRGGPPPRIKGRDACHRQHHQRTGTELLRSGRLLGRFHRPRQWRRQNGGAIAGTDYGLRRRPGREYAAGRDGSNCLRPTPCENVQRASQVRKLRRQERQGIFRPPPKRCQRGRVVLLRQREGAGRIPRNRPNVGRNGTKRHTRHVSPHNYCRQTRQRAQDARDGHEGLPRRNERSGRVHRPEQHSAGRTGQGKEQRCKPCRRTWQVTLPSIHRPHQWHRHANGRAR